MATKWGVTIMEYERGWGSRVDEIKEFINYDEALNFQRNFNADNDKDEVPDWYMVAHDPHPIK